MMKFYSIAICYQNKRFSFAYTHEYVYFVVYKKYTAGSTWSDCDCSGDMGVQTASLSCSGYSAMPLHGIQSECTLNSFQSSQSCFCPSGMYTCFQVCVFVSKCVLLPPVRTLVLR